MAFRTQKAIGVLILFLSSSVFAMAQPEWSITARHDHSVGSCTGTLAIGQASVSFKSKDHNWTWTDDDIQQFQVAPGMITVVMYSDSSLLRLGADREFKFEAPAEQLFMNMSGALRERLGARYIAAMPESGINALWELPVKSMGLLRGSEGKLIAGEDRLVFEATRRGESRTWTYDDIVNIATSGAYQLTITTIEKSFMFQLKRPLDDRRYNDLWLALQKKKGLRMF